MKKCSRCGSVYNDDIMFCANCGTQLQEDNQSSKKEKETSIFLCILSFLIPIVGFVLYFVKKEDNPKAASSYAHCAWAGFAIEFISALCA